MSPPPSAFGFATIVTLALINHPWLLDQFAEEVASFEIGDKSIASLLGAVTRIIFDEPGIDRERLVARLSDGPHGKVLERMLWESPFKRVGFLQPETPAAEVEAQFTDMIYRWRALPTLSKELQESANQLAETSEAEFERFAMLQQQVASVGLKHEGDDAGERDAAKRFQEMVAQVKRNRPKPGRRPDKRH